METPVQFANSKGDKLRGLLSEPTGSSKESIVVMSHGHSSSKNTKNFVKIKDILDQHALPSLRFDMWGHGESAGTFEDCTVTEAVDDILQALHYVYSNGYKKIALLGSSFGGLAGIIAASKTKDLSLLVLKSPVSNYKEKYEETEGEQFISNWKQAGIREYSTTKNLRLKYSFYEDALRNNGYMAARHIHVPTLIVHGDQDEIVPVKQSITISKLIPDCTLSLVHGADHVYSNPEHAQQMVTIITQFFITHL